jgi:hypothetical protein
VATPARIRDGRGGQALPAAHTGLRAVVVYGIGFLLLAANAWFGTYAYVVVQALIWTQTSLLRGPVVLLFFVVLANLLVVRVARRFALHQGELLALYAMLTLGTCAGGIGFVQFLVNQMAGVFYYATGENGWKEILWPHIPLWFAPRDPAVLHGFFRGNSTLYDSAVLTAWAVPVLAWSAFIFALFWTLLCATTLMRRSWVEEERLTFPLAQLPLQMTEPGGTTAFWKSPWMWAGFLLAGALESVNFLNFLYPSIPSIPIKPVGPNELDGFFTIRPWSEAGMFRLAFYPFAIGIGYLLSLEVSFSCWSFYLCAKAANVLSAALGFSAGGGSGPANRAPFLREQSVGAFLAIAIFSLWTARRALAVAWQEMRRPTGADRTELMSSRLARLGGGGGILFLVAFLSISGLAFPVALLFVLVYLCFALTLARIVSEAGAGWAWAPDWNATVFTTDAVGATSLSATSLVILHGYTSFTYDMRDNPMPQQVQGAKLAQAVDLSPRALLGPLVWASAFGILAAFWAHLSIYYTYGAASAKVRPWLTGFGTAPFRQAATLIATPTAQDVPGLVAAGFGMLLAVGLSLLRQRLPWWPLHPLGYALATTSSMDYMWFPFFLAWLAKWITLRYGGIQAYRSALPFFLGLILGDYVVPALWGLFGMVTGYQQYMAFPH